MACSVEVQPPLAWQVRTGFSRGKIDGQNHAWIKYNIAGWNLGPGCKGKGGGVQNSSNKGIIIRNDIIVDFVHLNPDQFGGIREFTPCFAHKPPKVAQPRHGLQFIVFIAY